MKYLKNMFVNLILFYGFTIIYNYLFEIDLWELFIIPVIKSFIANL